MTTLNWDVSNEDARLIARIADRALRELSVVLSNAYITRLDVVMDIQAAHANGNPLDLDALLKFPRFDFSHDIVGIIGHLNRETGKLENCFVPRCTRRELIERVGSVD